MVAHCRDFVGQPARLCTNIPVCWRPTETRPLERGYFERSVKNVGGSLKNYVAKRMRCGTLGQALSQLASGRHNRLDKC